MFRKYQDICYRIFRDKQYNSWMSAIDGNVYHDPKLDADHGRGHVTRVFYHAWQFLDKISGKIDEEYMTRLYLLLISTLLHDIALGTPNHKDHATRGADMAEEFLREKFQEDLSQTECSTIIHAIRNHSDGNETHSIIDAALILGDKLDIAYERFPNDEGLKDVRMGDLVREMRKIERAEFILEMSGCNLKAKRFDKAILRFKLRPNIDDPEPFNPIFLNQWPKAITVPHDIACNFLQCQQFDFMVEEQKIDLEKIIKF